MNKIFNHTCENMIEVVNNSVALTVTSPPYWNAIDYDTHAENSNNHYRTRKYSEGYKGYFEYLEWINGVFKEVLRVTKPGGFCAIVIGTVLFEGKHYPVPFDITSNLVKLGWEFHQDIIWHKTTAGVKRAGVTIQKPMPGYYYPNIMTEYILVFRKAGEPIYRSRNVEEKERSKFPINKLFTMDIANNIWHIAPVPPNILDHPCPYPEEIPYRLIKLYSYEGDLVLDPFTGSGQTPKVAAALHRNYVGYEIIQKYVDLTNKRIHEKLAVRPSQLIARFEKILLEEPINGTEKEINKRAKKKENGFQLDLLSHKEDQ